MMRIEDAAAWLGVSVAWKPFLLGPIFKDAGWQSSPFLEQPAKAQYMWTDMLRQCAKYGIAWTRPSSFPRAAVLPLRVMLAAEHEPWAGEFGRRVMSLNFAKDQDIHTPEAVGRVLEGLDLDMAAWIARAESPENKLRLREQTSVAQARGIFGAPTFFVGPEMFWGNDRLDDALALAARAARPA
jgi:2-hydroxychromene-2-carboxylate isomerase